MNKQTDPITMPTIVPVEIDSAENDTALTINEAAS